MNLNDLKYPILSLHIRFAVSATEYVFIPYPFQSIKDTLAHSNELLEYQNGYMAINP